MHQVQGEIYRVIILNGVNHISLGSDDGKKKIVIGTLLLDNLWI